MQANYGNPTSRSRRSQVRENYLHLRNLEVSFPLFVRALCRFDMSAQQSRVALRLRRKNGGLVTRVTHNEVMVLVPNSVPPQIKGSYPK